MKKELLIGTIFFTTAINSFATGVVAPTSSPLKPVNSAPVSSVKMTPSSVPPIPQKQAVVGVVAPSTSSSTSSSGGASSSSSGSGSAPSTSQAVKGAASSSSGGNSP